MTATSWSTEERSPLQAEPTAPVFSEAREPNLTETERHASVAAGGALLAFGLFRRSIPLAALGGYLAYRGRTGHCPLYQSLGIDPTRGEAGRQTSFERSITILRPRQEVYRFLQDHSNLPRVLSYVERVEPAGDGRERWYLKTPRRTHFQWDVETTENIPDERIAWRSAPGSWITIQIGADLSDAPGDRGTLVRMHIRYLPPGAGPGAAAGRAFQFLTAHQLQEDLRRMKQLLETGEIATTTRQPSGRSVPKRIADRILGWAS